MHTPVESSLRLGIPGRGLQKLSAAYRRLLLGGGAILSDILAIAVAAQVNGMNGMLERPAHAMTLLIVAIATFLPFAILNRIYLPETLVRTSQAISVAVAAALEGFLLLALITCTIGNISYSGLRHLAAYGVVLLAAISLGRALLATFAARTFPEGVYARAILIEHGRPGEHIAQAAINFGGKFDPESPGPWDYERLADVLRTVDSVMVHCHPDRRALWVKALRGMNVDVEVFAPELDRLATLELRAVDGRIAALVERAPFRIYNRAVKRLFDILISSAAIILVFPLLLATALAIKLDSPGTVLFRQPRIGRQNKTFPIYKFRSMRSDLCDTKGLASTARDDNRITRVGTFIRRTSIDELPQLFNVLLGQMSIVGPRPHAIFSTAEGKLFWDVDARYWSRHSCKPGITGLAQVNGYRGATERCEDIVNRVTSDLEYVAGWSLRRDIGILLRTARVLVHENAY